MGFDLAIDKDAFKLSGARKAGSQFTDVQADTFNLATECLPKTMTLLATDASARFDRTIMPALAQTASTMPIADQIILANSLISVLGDLSAVVTIAKLGMRKAKEVAPSTQAQLSYEQVIEKIKEQVGELESAFQPDPILKRIGFTNLAILRYLDGVGEAMMSDIARAAGHSTAAATGSVDRLSKFCMGSDVFVLAERENAIDDRRKIYVKLTQHGKLISLQSKVQDLMDQILD